MSNSRACPVFLTHGAVSRNFQYKLKFKTKKITSLKQVAGNTCRYSDYFARPTLPIQYAQHWWLVAEWATPDQAFVLVQFSSGVTIWQRESVTEVPWRAHSARLQRVPCRRSQRNCKEHRIADCVDGRQVRAQVFFSLGEGDSGEGPDRRVEGRQQWWGSWGGVAVPSPPARGLGSAVSSPSSPKDFHCFQHSRWPLLTL